MDISKYKKYIRNLSIEDEDLDDLIRDVIEDIARDTKIFRDVFGFSVSSCLSEYSIKSLYEFYLENDSRNEVKTITPITDADKFIEFANQLLGSSCIDVNFVNETYETIEESKENRILSVSQIATVDKNGIHNFLDGKIAQLRNGMTLVLDVEEFEKRYGKDTVLPVIVSVVIVPDVQRISEEVEAMLKTAIINGIKYFVSDTYSDPNNAQVGNLLYQRYYSSKKQLLYNYPQSDFPLFSFNREWNI